MLWELRLLESQSKGRISRLKTPFRQNTSLLHLPLRVNAPQLAQIDPGSSDVETEGINPVVQRGTAEAAFQIWTMKMTEKQIWEILEFWKYLGSRIPELDLEGLPDRREAF
ncbi:hypothetical protein PGTUg99_008206 [Puccinia graminis f. sp. tritici]|uniref:Uncharacterized protein n=1 Tax=Puccinia graminis f. sp. tritici TaxID=56615 RepID=A0A5B0MPZ3_PUCGR|nr:hypothetical protein PGTUg99_008206 [Puccinia graminis f. sp. tritici]